MGCAVGVGCCFGTPLGGKWLFCFLFLRYLNPLLPSPPLPLPAPHFWCDIYFGQRHLPLDFSTSPASLAVSFPHIVYFLEARGEDSLEQWSPNRGMCTPGGAQGYLVDGRRNTRISVVFFFKYKKVNRLNFTNIKYMYWQWCSNMPHGHLSHIVHEVKSCFQCRGLTIVPSIISSLSAYCNELQSICAHTGLNGFMDYIIYC